MMRCSVTNSCLIASNCLVADKQVLAHNAEWVRMNWLVELEEVAAVATGGNLDDIDEPYVEPAYLGCW